MACRTAHHHQVGLHPPSNALLLQGPGPLPFHLGVTVTQHQHPHSDQGWSGRRAGVHAWKESGGDMAEGQLGTLPRNHSDRRRAEDGAQSKHCKVTFSAQSLSKT